MVWAWLGAAGVGLSLGLLGSGGAILTVPILVYLVGHDEKVAIVESLAIVGLIALSGAWRAWRGGRLDTRSAALLALPGVAGTWLGAWVAGFVAGAVQLALLAVLMLTAAGLMFRGGRREGRGAPAAGGAADGGRVGIDQEGLAIASPTSDLEGPTGSRRTTSDRAWVVVLQGVGLGLATGLVGVGGGFLIVPVLVLVRKLEMSRAVGTSLAIIAFNCASGLLGHWVVGGTEGPASRVSWATVGVFTALGVLGSVGGSALGARIKQRTLRQVFAVFLVVMAGYILVRQWPRVFGASNRAVSVGLSPGSEH